MITLTSQYAIRAVMHIARENRWCTADHIAVAAMAPRGYISKVLQTLVETRILSSQRGLNGGFRLVGDADSITAYDIVHAIDSEDHLGVCRNTHEDGSAIEESANKLFCDIQSDVDHRLRKSAISDLISTSNEQAVGSSSGSRTA